MTQPVVFRNLSYRVNGRSILRNFNLEIASGETLVLLGRSGSGKTTALKMVNALLFPSDGDVLVDGRSTREWDLLRLRRGIGYVIQEVGLFPHFTVERNVGLVPRLDEWEPARIAARTRELLTAVGLPPDEFLTRYPRELSGGQRQRVGVARALAANPKLLLFDEPFGALDPVTRLELQDQLIALRRDFAITSIFVTHDVREALRLASRIAVLRNGALETVAPPQEFLRAQTPEADAFLACIRENS